MSSFVTLVIPLFNNDVQSEFETILEQVLIDLIGLATSMFFPGFGNWD